MITEVSLLSYLLASPRRGNLESVFHIFVYLDSKNNANMVFNITYPDIEMSDFKTCDWKEFYAQLRKIFQLTHPYPLVRRWVCAYTLIRIMLGTRPPGDLALETLYSSTSP